MSIQIRTAKGLRDLDSSKIMDSLRFASVDLKKVDIQRIFEEVQRSLYHHISTDDIIMLTIKTAANYIPKHYEYSYLTSRLMLQKLYKEVFGESVYEYEDFYSTRYTLVYENYLDKGIQIGLIDPRLKTDFDLEKIKLAMKPENDLLFKEVGMGRIYNQYLLKTNTDPQQVFELPQFWLMRVAMGLALAEKDDIRTQKAIEFYGLLSSQQLLNSTPSLLNAGRVRNQCSSCFLLTVEDSLEGIYKNYTDIAFLSKYAGGIGVDYTNIRSTGALIKGTNGKSLGLIPFLKVLDSSAAAVNQGGVRKGAVAVYLEPWHRDVFDFIACKYVSIDENRRCPNIHTVLWIPDLFMKRVLENGVWTLFSPSDVPDLHQKYGSEFEKAYIQYEQDENTPKETVQAQDLWKEVLVSLLGKGFGHPWITFKDPSNACNADEHEGVVHSSNLCTEILLPTNKNETAVCNLASINLSKFVQKDYQFTLKDTDLQDVDIQKAIDWDGLAKVVKTAIRMLDNVIDVNFYTTKEAEFANKKHRPIGLGVMGLQSMFQQLGVAMDSDEAVSINDTLFEFLNYNALQASVELAKEKGRYSVFAGSKWSNGILPIDSMRKHIADRGVATTNDLETQTLDWDALRSEIMENGLRNSQVMALAPTRSISYLAGTSPSIEPWDSNIFTEVGMTGKYQMINEDLVDCLENRGLWSEEIAREIEDNDGSVQNISEIPFEIRRLFQTAWEIHPKWIISQNARRQKWVDMGISFNMWLPNNNGKDAERLYMEAWKAGLKTTYYLHSKSKTQADKTMKTTVKEIETTIIETNLVNKPAEVVEPMEIVAGAVCDRTDPDCEACQ